MQLPANMPLEVMCQEEEMKPDNLALSLSAEGVLGEAYTRRWCSSSITSVPFDGG